MSKMKSTILDISEQLFLNLVRILACLFIFFCYASSTSGTPFILQFSPHFFNVGVPIFFMILVVLHMVSAKMTKLLQRKLY